MNTDNTGLKDGKGRTIWRGPRGGLYVRGPSGTKIRPAQRPAAAQNTDNTGQKDGKGRTIWRGPKGGLYVRGPSGTKIRPAKGGGGRPQPQPQRPFGALTGWMGGGGRPNNTAEPPARPVRVEGPYQYARYKLGTGATIHLFGEVHQKKPCQSCKQPECWRITDLIRHMIATGKRTEQRIDVFIEQHFSNTDPDVLRCKGFVDCHLADAMIRVGTRSEGRHLRTHRIDMRNRNHPIINNLWTRGLAGGAMRNVSRQMQLLQIVLTSDQYNADLQRMGYLAKRRNSTTHEGRSVSRVRKQLLKLPAALREQLITAFYGLPPDEFGISVLLMDLAHLARMLYYAGHGAPQPARVLVSYDGGAHTDNMTRMMDQLIARGALDAVRQESKNDLAPWKGGECLKINLPANYGFSTTA